MTKDTNNLLPCPFCGSRPVWDECETVLACMATDCFGPRTTATEGDAIVQWNTRAAERNLRLELSGLAQRAEAFRTAMIQSGALNHVPQSAYFVPLRRLEQAIAMVNERSTEPLRSE